MCLLSYFRQRKNLIKLYLSFLVRSPYSLSIPNGLETLKMYLSFGMWGKTCLYENHIPIVIA